MKGIIRVLNVIVAVCCILIIAGMIWFLYLTFVRGYGGYGAVAYILNQFWGWWEALWRPVGAMLP